MHLAGDNVRGGQSGTGGSERRMNTSYARIRVTGLGRRWWRMGMLVLQPDRQLADKKWLEVDGCR